MIKDRTIQINHRRLAAKMIMHGMRASVVASILDMPLAQARALYEEITGRSSPSGQTPRSTEYYFAPVMRTHASAFLQQYKCLNGWRDDQREAFVAAYDRYATACYAAAGKAPPETAPGGNDATALLPIDRAWRLVQLWRQNDGTIREARCAKCHTYTIIQSFEAATRYVCPACQGSLDVSARLRGRSGRRPKQAPLPKRAEQRSAITKRAAAAERRAAPPDCAPDRVKPSGT